MSFRNVLKMYRVLNRLLYLRTAPCLGEMYSIWIGLGTSATFRNVLKMYRVLNRLHSK
jgi:hypothetical protein